MKLDLEDFRDPRDWQCDADVLEGVQVGMRLFDLSPQADSFQYLRTLSVQGIKKVLPYVVGEMLASLEQDDSPFAIQIGYFVAVMADPECQLEFEKGLTRSELQMLFHCLERVIVRFRSAAESATRATEADYLQECLRDAETAVAMWSKGRASPERGTGPAGASDR